MRAEESGMINVQATATRRARLEATVELMSSEWEGIVAYTGELSDADMMSTIHRRYREGAPVFLPNWTAKGDRSRQRMNLLFAGFDWQDVMDFEREGAI
jgi:hypothetical protein